MGKNDFFGDGRSDIILQNADGSVVLWDMSGPTIVNAGLVGNPGASWSVDGHGQRHNHHTGFRLLHCLRGVSSPFQPLALRRKTDRPLPLGGIPNPVD